MSLNFPFGKVVSVWVIVRRCGLCCWEMFTKFLKTGPKGNLGRSESNWFETTLEFED